MRVEYKTAPRPDMIDGEWRSPKTDTQARLVVRSESSTDPFADMLASNRTVKALDILLSGGVWVVQLEDELGAAIVSTTIGSVAVDGAGAVALPLDLVALGGSAASEIRVFGAGVLKVIHSTPAKATFPVNKLKVEDAEVVAQSISKIHAIGAGITQLSISWGG